MSNIKFVNVYTFGVHILQRIGVPYLFVNKYFFVFMFECICIQCDPVYMFITMHGDGGGGYYY